MPTSSELMLAANIATAISPIMPGGSRFMQATANADSCGLLNWVIAVTWSA